MSPLAIEIALHYNRRGGTDFPIPPGTMSQAEVIAQFVRDGMLVDHGQQEVLGRYEATDKLIAWVEFLCAVPLPVKVWKLPEAGQT